MKYISTRGGISPVSFKEAVMMGLATDGGLLLPESIPSVSAKTVEGWRGLNYQDLAHEILSLFVDDIPADDLRDLIESSYRNFNHPEITPTVKVGEVFVLELFHGPTLAFKDVALQFLGNVFEYLLQESGSKMNILGATSGDTGSAAIYGVRGKKGINIFILHPHKRVSRIQERQMTTVIDPNVFNIAFRGTFDDGQAIVKSIFNDIPFKDKYHLGAINSINWARIVAQIVYYIYAALRVIGDTGAGKVDFSVPTGNFGDIFAGYLARRLTPRLIGNLVLATNENDLLSRFVLNGEYAVGSVVQTSSPSMDIQVASNFERYLYYLHEGNQKKVAGDLKIFAETGSLKFDPAQQEKIRKVFLSRSISEEETLATISSFDRDGYLLDPHTAVGVRAGLDFKKEGTPMICLATAHPAKFGDAVLRATGHEPDLPASLADLANRDARCEVMDAKAETVRDFVSSHALK
ncbi:MAG: threonine synthase [Proteobacteria bacterium]|nr:threonine synthase [Pseudomonadota bacterium]MBU1716346.1 threonine synthase [Pseudomonadota bacterium]